MSHHRMKVAPFAAFGRTYFAESYGLELRNQQGTELALLNLFMAVYIIHICRESHIMDWLFL